MRKFLTIIAMVTAISGCQITEREFWVGPDPCDNVPEENRWYHQGCH